MEKIFVVANNAYNRANYKSSIDCVSATTKGYAAVFVDLLPCWVRGLDGELKLIEQTTELIGGEKWHMRANVLMPNGIPRYIRCYDDGGEETLDRYTVVFTGRYRHKTGGGFVYLAMSENLGICQHGSHSKLIDKPTYSHLGKKIKFRELPEPCRKAVLDDYIDLWDIN